MSSSDKCKFDIGASENLVSPPRKIISKDRKVSAQTGGNIVNFLPPTTHFF